MSDIKKWLTSLGACSDGKLWAVENCRTKQEVWDTAKPERLIWLATQKGVVDEKTQHRFSCWCVRQIWHLLTDERSKNAVEVKERWIEGLATDDELAAASAAARDAAWAAARDAAWAAASAAAWDAASAAASAAAWDAASAAARAAARDAQAKWLRDNATPNFDIRG